MIDRHVGWEVYQAYRSGSNKFLDKVRDSRNVGEIKALLERTPKENGTLSSLDLARLGSLIG